MIKARMRMRMRLFRMGHDSLECWPSPDFEPSETKKLNEFNHRENPVVENAGLGRHSSEATSTYYDAAEEQEHSTNTLETLTNLKYTFAPLIRVTDEGEEEIGEIQWVASPVLLSILSTLDEIDSRHQHGKLPAHPQTGSKPSTCCAWVCLLVQRAMLAGPSTHRGASRATPVSALNEHALCGKVTCGGCFCPCLHR